MLTSLCYCNIIYFLQVFGVQLNKQHTVVEDLDIYAKVGRGVAHDEIVPFSVKNGMLKVAGETSAISNNKIPVEFTKVQCVIGSVIFFAFVCVSNFAYICFVCIMCVNCCLFSK